MNEIETLAQELAEAKRLYAESFLLYRTKVSTDKQAEAMAEIDHGERVLMAQARLDMARRGV